MQVSPQCLGRNLLRSKSDQESVKYHKAHLKSCSSSEVVSSRTESCCPLSASDRAAFFQKPPGQISWYLAGYLPDFSGGRTNCFLEGPYPSSATFRQLWGCPGKKTMLPLLLFLYTYVMPSTCLVSRQMFIQWVFLIKLINDMELYCCRNGGGCKEEGFMIVIRASQLTLCIATSWKLEKSEFHFLGRLHSVHMGIDADPQQTCPSRWIFLYHLYLNWNTPVGNQQD